MKELQLSFLHPSFDAMQKKYGCPKLNAIYGGGCIHKPNVCFVFMNPTGRNVASSPNWEGMRAQWLGTKNIWKLFYRIGYLKEDTFLEIMRRKPKDWDPSFARHLYEELAQNKIYITNLAKCTQEDARPLPNTVFKEYLHLLEKEIEILDPKYIVTFGNQVSSIILGQNISVSKVRGEFFLKEIGRKKYPIYPTFYPVGQGMRNIDLAIQDILNILAECQ